VFVRQQDATPGSGAPPSPIVREEEPEEILEEEDDKKPEDPFAEEEVAEAPGPSYGLEMSDVRWIREPNARDFARFYPDRALDDGRSGRVTLDCVIAGSGRLDCSVAQESPGGYGFGEAALGISRQVRVDTDLPGGGNAAGRRLRLPLSFQAR
jgi:periplasmic protein TonB